MAKFIMLLLAMMGALMSTLSMQVSANNFFEYLNPKLIKVTPITDTSVDEPMPLLVTEVSDTRGKLLLEPYKIKPYANKHKFTLRCTNNTIYAAQNYSEDGKNTEMTLVSGQTNLIPYLCKRVTIPHTKAIYVYGFNPQ